MTAIALIILRIVGLIWAVGAVLIIRNARAHGDSEAARWVLAGGILTMATGLLLVAASRWAVPLAILLAAQQAVFHWRQSRILPPDMPRPNPSHVIVAILVALAAAYLASRGALY